MTTRDLQRAEPVADGPSGQEEKPRPPARLVVERVTKEFQRHGGDLLNAVDDVSFEVAAGEILVLLGPSGCGKSTLLRCIAGLEMPTEGLISIDGDTVYDPTRKIAKPPNERDVNMMFQSYALWPHMNLEDNVAYPLRSTGTKKAVARERAREYLDLVGLTNLGKQHPGMISGGQQQRVALARTLISEPSIVLFDEPLSNVDARIRVKLRALLVRLHSQLNFAAVYVTHDQVEAMGLATRIAVMRNGRVDQIDSPVEVYEAPSNRSTAEFIGEGNFFHAKVVEQSPEAVTLEVRGHPVALPVSAWPYDRAPRTGEDVLVMVRPEHCRLSQGKPEREQAGVWSGNVTGVTFAGAMTEYECQVDNLTVTAWHQGPPRADLQEGTPVTVELPSDMIKIVADD